MSTLKKAKLDNLSTLQSKLLFNYFEANKKKKAFTKLTADLKDPAVTIVDALGGQEISMPATAEKVWKACKTMKKSNAKAAYEVNYENI